MGGNRGERGTCRSEGPCGAGPDWGCPPDKGAPERRGLPRWGPGAECNAGGLGAAGRVLFSPFSAGACGLGWVPAAEIRAAAAEGRVVVRRGAGRSPGSPAVGRPGWAWLLPARGSAQGGIPHARELLCDFPPTSRPVGGKVCRGRS